MEDRSDDQGALDRSIRVDLGSTPALWTASTAPRGHRLLVDPQRETPTGNQRLIVLGPVANPVLEDEI